MYHSAKMVPNAVDKQPESHTPDSLPSSVPLPVPPKLPINICRGLRSGLAISLMLFSAYLGAIFFQGPLLPLAIFAPKAFRRAADFTIASWLMLTEFLIFKLMQVRVRHFGDQFRSATSSQHASLLLLNHRTQLDWFFSWGLGIPVQRMKIILKESLAQMPGAGWAMQCGAFVFLRRQIATDENRIRQLVDYLWRVGSNCQLFLFPEGTDLNLVSLSRSNEFASKSGWPYVTYTLHPRSTGFICLVTLLGPDRLTDVYDVTVAYPDHLPSPEINILVGQVPTEVHYHVKRVPASEILLGGITSDQRNERLAEWLRSRWLSKEALLKAYYADPIGSRRFENEIPVQSHVFHLPDNSDTLRITPLGLANAIFWGLSLLGFMYILWFSWIVRIYAIFVQSCFLYLSFAVGGVTQWASRHVTSFD